MKRKQESRSFLVKKEEKSINWLHFDAEGRILGRFASEIAKVLRGKHKASFTPNLDMGDGVIIVNAEKIKVTGSKKVQKIYRHHTGYMGGMREIPYDIMLARNPEEILRHAIAGMMPKSRLAKQQLRKLRIFKGAEHKLEAQQPIYVK